MKRLASIFILTSTLVIGLRAGQSIQGPASDEFLGWNADRAQVIGRSMYEQGRVGGFFDTRILSTDRSYNYKLAATWLTPDVIRATARLRQIQSRLSVDATRQLVADATRSGETVILVEIDPREGSGVVPLTWEAFLQPSGASAEDNRVVPGRVAQELRDVPALAGTMRRNYDYDRFWVVFPLNTPDGATLLSNAVKEVELVVRIHDKEGRVRWTVPDSLRRLN